MGGKNIAIVFTILIYVLTVCLPGFSQSAERIKHPDNPINTWDYLPRESNYYNVIKQELEQKGLEPAGYHFRKFPIKYWIQDMPEKWETIVRDCFKEYGYFIPVEETKDYNNADIFVTAEDDLSGVKKTDKQKAVGLGGLQISGEKMWGEVQLLYSIFSKNNMKFAPRVVKHEIGHALGLCGHSNDSNDVMFTGGTFVISSNNKRYHVQGRGKQRPIGLMGAFSARDLNTLWLLYNQW